MKRLKNRDLIAIKKRMMKRQNNICPLCKRDLTKIQLKDVTVDHDHTTGVIRAAICRQCNGSEGYVKKKAIRCTNSKNYQSWIINLAELYKGKTFNKEGYLHPTFRTQREEKDLSRKRAREAYKKKKRKLSKISIEVSERVSMPLVFKEVE